MAFRLSKKNTFIIAFLIIFVIAIVYYMGSRESLTVSINGDPEEANKMKEKAVQFLQNLNVV